MRGGQVVGRDVHVDGVPGALLAGAHAAAGVLSGPARPGPGALQLVGREMLQGHHGLQPALVLALLPGLPSRSVRTEISVWDLCCYKARSICATIRKDGTAVGFLLLRFSPRVKDEVSQPGMGPDESSSLSRPYWSHQLLLAVLEDESKNRK